MTVGLAHHEIFRAKVGKGSIIHNSDLSELKFAFLFSKSNTEVCDRSQLYKFT